MPIKEKLIAKLFSDKMPRNCTMFDVRSLLSKFDCEEFSGGRGSSVAFRHKGSDRILIFDAPHGSDNLKPYHIKMLREYVEELMAFESEQ